MATVKMMPPDRGTSLTTSYVSGRTYVCSPLAYLLVPDYDMPGLRAQGWYAIGNVLTQPTTIAPGIVAIQ